MIILPAILEGLNSRKDKTFRISFATNELTPEQFTGLGGNLNKFGYLAFKEDEFRKNEIKSIEELKTDYDDNEKSPSQWLRAILYRLWEKVPEGYKDFELYYRFKIRTIGEHLKTKIPD